MSSAFRNIVAAFTLVLALLLSGAAIAQDPPDFEAFHQLAQRVETDLQEDRISDQAFENLRTSLVDWRETFLAAQDTNATQIETLKAQLEALGPAPSDGSAEPEDIASRRASLTEQLAKAREPQIAADEARARANALIAQIDTTLRNRQANELVQLQRTPLDPTLWPAAAAWLGQAFNDIGAELSRNIESRVERGTLWDRLPVTVLLVVIAIVLVARGPKWVERLIRRVEARSSEHGRVVFGFLVSLGTIAAPLIAVTLLNLALLSTGLLGPTGARFALGVNLLILAYAAGRWLGRRVFPVRDDIPSAWPLDEVARRHGRGVTQILGILVGLLLLVESLSGLPSMSKDVASVYSLPLFVLIGLGLFRLGNLLNRRESSDGEPGQSASFQAFVVSSIGWGIRVVAIVGPLAAAIGYYHMARAILLPTTLTLGLLALLATLHIVIRAAYGMARGVSGTEASQALAPVLISFALALASLPLITLIWGARTTDLEEIWTRIKTGFRLGDATISPGAILTFALVFAIGFTATRLLQGTLRSTVLPRTRMDKGGQNAIVSGVGYVGITIAALVGITSAGIDLSSFAIIIGALGVGIGFGLQNIVNNFVSGIILLIERPIGEGDWVEVNGQMGIVKAISVRSTRIETFDRTDVVVPNGDLISGTVTNWTRGNSIGRVIVPVGVAYGTDTRKVEKILLEIAEAHALVSVTPPPTVLFTSFGADSLNFEIRAILTDINFLGSVRSDMNHEIARRFQEEGIEIPFAQRDLWLRNPEALRDAVRRKSAEESGDTSA